MASPNLYLIAQTPVRIFLMQRRYSRLNRRLKPSQPIQVIKRLLSARLNPSIFIAGADIPSLANASPGDLSSLIDLGHEVFNQIADLKIPTVAAIHGACLGGGYEIALACDWRIATEHKSTKIGLPETQLGILPAWGGTTRLSRLLTLPKALPLILAGKTLECGGG